MTTAMHMRIRRWVRDHPSEVANGLGFRSIKPVFGTKIHAATRIMLIVTFLTGLPLMAGSQALSGAEATSNTLASAPSSQIVPAYSRPTEKTRFRNYAFDAFGPYPIVASGLAAGINQLNNTPPEWHQGAEGFGKRFGSDFGIAFTSTTTRYALSKAFHEDTLYYQCICQGFIPRLSHAALSTLAARRGNDGHSVFSVPALIAPYAGSMTAVYGWYPDRYGAKDAFRMGNYSLLESVAGNIGLEFFFSGPHSLLAHMHLSNAHGSPDPGPNP